MRLIPSLLLLTCLSSCSLSQGEVDLIDDFRLRAAQYYEVNDLGRAQQQAVRGLQIDPEDGELNHILGRTLLKRGDPDAVQLARGPLELAHEQLDSARSSYSMGEYHLRHGQLLRGAAAVLRRKSADIDPVNRRLVADHQAEIEDYEKRGEEHIVTSLTFLERAVDERPEWIEALQHIASAQTHLHRDEEALLSIGRLVEVLGRSRDYKNTQLATSETSVAQERSLRQSLLRDIAWEVESRGLAATILMNREDWKEADAQLTEVLRLAPNLESEYFNRGLARYHMGRLAEAAGDMRAFLGRTSLDQESEQVKRALDVLSEFDQGRGGS